MDATKLDPHLVLYLQTDVHKLYERRGRVVFEESRIVQRG
jgi:hypothetical protein